MEIIDNKALLLNVKRPHLFTNTIKDCVVLGENPSGSHSLLVRWSFDNVEALVEMGIVKTPSTILKDYKWAGRFKPMRHQLTTADFIVKHKRCFVFNEAGTGKTACVAWATDYLLNKQKINRVLIVCPLSIMKAAWQRDLFQVLPHRSVGIAHGTPKTRRAVISGKYEYVVINYDGIEIVLDEILAGGFDMIIVDEANAYKSTSTRRWKTFKKLLSEHTRLVMMTGTPAAQSPEDAFGLAKLVNPANVPNFAGAWKDLVMQKISMFKYVPRPRAKELVFKALQPAIRYTKEECLDLPEIVYETREVPLTAQQEKYYNILKTQELISAAGEEVSAVNAAAKITKLLQISCGAVYSDDGSVLSFDVSNRLAELEAVIDESLKKVIVFAPFTHTIQLIQEYLHKKKISNMIINGEVSANKRNVAFNAFQDEVDPRVLIIQPQAAAHGVTLTAASTIVWFGPTPSVETYIQANARAHRKGQDHKVTVVMIQGSQAEAKMYKMLNSNVENHEGLVELYNSIIKD